MKDPPALSWNLLDRGLLLRILADWAVSRKEIEARKLRDRVVFNNEIRKCAAPLDLA
jgi:hypothetical protein